MGGSRSRKAEHSVILVFRVGLGDLLGDLLLWGEQIQQGEFSEAVEARGGELESGANKRFATWRGGVEERDARYFHSAKSGTSRCLKHSTNHLASTPQTYA